jgi:predicted transcriptional regulator YdeE
MSFVLSRIEKEPRITTLREPILFVGMETNTDARSIYRDSARLGEEYRKFKERHQIPDLQEPWAFVAYSVDFIEKTRSWKYILGDVVTKLDAVPEGLGGNEIPPATYAVFPVRAKFKFLWGIEITRTKKYLIQEWLPNSKYRGTGSDFEYHDDRSTGNKPSIDLYVEIEEM